MHAKKPRPFGKKSSGESGAELIEMALTLPLLLMVCLAIVDFGLMFQKYEIVTNAAREGVRLAARPNITPAEVITRVNNYVQNAGLPVGAGSPTVVVTPTTITSGPGTWQASQVDVSYPHDYLFLGPFSGWFGGGLSSVTLSAQAVMRLQTGGTGLP